MPLDFGDIDHQTFFSEYWRKKPLHVKGVAPSWLGFTYSRARFRAAVDALEREADEHISRTGDGTIFLQNMDVVSAELSDLSRRFAEELSCRRVWFDAVWAVDDSGIGSHYDHSDNFVLQQEGTKIWRLYSPDRVPQEELQRRMLDAPDTGLIDMPDDAPEFVLEPGDMLYIPLFWAHWGVSVGSSLSVSVVYNADNALDVLLPRLKGVLESDPRWWRPLPTLAPESAGDRRARDEDQARGLFDELLRSLQAEPFREEVRRSWWSSAFERREIDEIGDEDDGGGPARMYGGGRARAPADELIDASALSELSEQTPGELDVEDFATLGGAEETDDTITLGVLQHSLHQLLAISESAAQYIRDRDLSSTVKRVFTAVARMDPELIAAALVRPEIASWLFRAHEAVDSSYVPRVEAVFAHASSLWLPFLVASDTVSRSDIQVTLSRPGALDLLAFGSVLQLDGAAGEIIVSRVGEALEARWDGGELSVDPGALMGDHPALKACPRVGDEGPVHWSDNPWLFGFAPFGGRFSARRLSPGPSAVEAVAGAIERLDEVWPAAAKTIREQVDVIVPCDADGDFGAAPGWPGLIALHDVSPLALVEAMAADRFFRASTVMDWLDNHPEERFEHQGRARKIAWGMARLYVEAQAAQLRRRLGAADVARSAAARALQAALADRAQFTAGGRALFDVLSRRLDDSYTA